MQSNTVIDITKLIDMTPESKILQAQKLCAPWARQLAEIARAFMKHYPPDKTPAEVMHAVTVPVTYTAFLALLNAMDAVISQPTGKESNE